MRALVLFSIVLVGVGCRKSEAAPSEEGRTLFATACARCHGVEGGGGLPLWDGGPSPRNFTDHAFQETHTDFDIQNTVVNGKGAGMPPFGSTFNDAQLSALVSHVRSLDSERKKK